MSRPPVLHPVIETLEPRIAPAGIVMLGMTNGVLNITGDGAANDMQLTDAGGGQWAIAAAPGGTTQFSFNGGPLLPAITFAAPHTLRANLGAGADEFVMSGLALSGALSINGQDGNDSFLLSNVSVGGAVLIDAGAGADEVDFTSTQFAGSVTVRMGAGDDYFTAGGHLFFARGLSTDLGAGQDTFDLNAITLSSNAAISAVSSGSAVEMQTFVLAAGTGMIKGSVTLRATGSGSGLFELGALAGDDMRVTGGLSITGGSGNDTVDIIGHLAVGGAMSLSLGNGFNRVLTPDLETLTAGHISYLGGSGSDQFSLGGSHVTVQGNVTFNGGGGSNYLDLYQTTSLRIGNALSYAGGAFNDDLIIDGANAVIGGKIIFNGGNGNNSLGFNAINGSAGSVSYNGGSGNDVADIGQFEGASNLITVRGNVAINMGGGSSDVTVRDAYIHGHLNVSSNAGWGSIDTVQIIDSDVLGNTSLNVTGWADADVFVQDSIFDGSFYAATGGGDDYVLLDTEAAGSSIYSTFHGAVTIYLGAGNDVFAAGRAPAVATVGVNFNSRVYVDGGSGYDYGYLVHPDYNNVFNGPQPYGRFMEIVN